jgi:hypothetical protein
MSTTREPPENAAYAEFASRIVCRFAKRVGEGDIDALPDLLALRDQLDRQTAEAVAALRAAPHYYSAAQIADRIGVTRQAVTQRWPDTAARKPGGQPVDRR